MNCRRGLFFILLSILGVAYTQAVPSSTPLSFNQSFKKITQTQPQTFFYQIPISPKGKIETRACAYCPIEETSVVAMPIVPLEWLAKNLPCYQNKLCSKPNHMSFKGLSCCNQISSLYQLMSHDLHNWVPETRQIKQLRGKHIPGILPLTNNNQSSYDIRVDKKKHVIHIPDAKRGTVARIYLYMTDTYQIKMDRELRATLESWDKLYGVTDWEKTRNRLIYNLQGKANEWVERL